MNVTLERAQAAQVHVSTEREITPRSAAQSAQKAAENSGFSIDVSGIALGTDAYAEHGKTAEEVMLEAGQEDLAAKRDYMAIMAGTMSKEDFAKLQEEGFQPGSMEIETVETIVDCIKAELLKGGNQVVGYTDTISDEVLKSLVGNEAFANELKEQFAKKDIPLTQENVSAVVAAWNMLSEADIPSDGNVKYMVENDLSPTPENLYTAKYSSISDGNRQGRGYYAQGGVAGYYAKKPEKIDFEKLRPQMEKVIEEAGYGVDEESFENAKWLVEKGIPLNTDTFSLLSDIRTRQFPVSYEDFMAAAACAIADGTPPAKADLGKNETCSEKAADLAEKTAAIEDSTADIILARDLPLTLRNLLAAQNGTLYNGNGQGLVENIRGRRLLEEVRLSMTVEANLILLRKGYQIETAPLEELIGKLKEAESHFAKALTGEVDDSKAFEKASLYQETIKTLQGIKTSPAAILAQVSEEDTLREVYVHGNERKADYEKAGQSYETMMTAPRKDMGDSIQKAFRNVDDILTDMDLELSDENRRAVRILGYNSLEITQENIREIREKDDLLSGVVKEMKPGRVLDMIRDGVNPLTMSLEELENYLGQQTDTAQEMESYSRFLYKLEKQNGITEEERSAYIGIYRLVRQIEKADDAAVGALWQTGAEFTLGNLLGAVRSTKRGHMDYSVDDRFGGVNARSAKTESITEQIAKGYQEYGVFDRQGLKQLLEEAGDESAGEEFDSMMYEQMRAAVKSEDTVLRHLLHYQQPVTADNLMAAGNLLKNPREIWQEIKRLKKQEGFQEDNISEENTEGFLEEMGSDVLEKLDDVEKAQNAYELFQEKVQGMLENMAFSDSYGALDVKALSSLYKQITFMGNMAREENYEIPANINGTPTSINLKIIHNSQKESQVAITFETEKLGKTAAKFKMTDQGLSGFCACSLREGCEFLKDNKELLEEKLAAEGIQTGEIYFAVGEAFNLSEFTLKETGNRQDGSGAQMLYQAAKAFIGYVQETGIRKEM